MKRALHYLPPLQSVVYGYTRRMLDETATNAQSFAMGLAERYIDTTAPDVRRVAFRKGDDPAADMRHNSQIFRRYMDGTVHSMPADLLDAWVTSLPEPYRGDCERDLARRRGLLVVKPLPEGGTSPAVGLANLTSEFGDLLMALAPALADGKLCAKDLPHARRILNESDDLISAVIAIRREVQGLLPGAESLSD